MGIGIEILENVIRMNFPEGFPVTSVKTSLSLSMLNGVSKNKDGYCSVNLRDGRNWQLSALAEFISDTYPIATWDGLPIATNEELFTKIESILPK